MRTLPCIPTIEQLGRRFKLLCVVGALCLAGMVASAQPESMTLDELVQSAEQWANENLDESVLGALKQVDRERVKEFLAEVQKQFHGEYIVDLAYLKEPAQSILPILEGYEDTLPYAVWLKSRLDYFDVADDFRLLIPPLKPEPGRPPKAVPNPTPQKEREVWIKKFTHRPWPAAARNLVPRLKPIFAAEKVPPELVWIAEVESTFDPRARSPVGAAGLFQLMPATAKRFGLRVGLLDQRLKPEESARAAAKYLAYLHGRFKEWRLALAAYNAGEGTVEKLLARQKERSFDAIATRLPAETQLYVPKVEATILRREGLKLNDLPAAAAR